MHQGKGKLLHSAAAAALLWATTVQAGPMSLDGQFSVSESGAATYTIPIQVPPGTGGVEPKLALTYNSQTGNGLLGVGWSLSGLSAITRCPRTLAQDNVRGSVNFDNNDRFCLDGQRLLAVNGTYGADGTEYRTERESYSKIVSYGTAGNGPAWFKVWTKAGQVIEYGNTADSRIEAIKAPNSTATWPTTTARLWAINKVADTKGNYLTYSYTEDQANGDYYPTRIDYTGNDNANVAPNNSVQFVYETRTDTPNRYFLGSFSKTTKRLKTVQLYTGSTLVGERQLSYQTGTATQRSRLADAKACFGAGNCLSGTTYGWQEHNKMFAADAAWGTRSTSYNAEVMGFRAGDVNGDGLTDAVYEASNGVLQVMMNTGTGFNADANWGSRAVAYHSDQKSFQLVDMNGDGLSDLVYEATNGVVRVLLSSGSNFSSDVAWGTRSASYNGEVMGFRLGDMNGDGLTDAVYEASNGVLQVMLNTGTGFNADANWGSRAAAYHSDLKGFQLVDMNGDGLADLVYEAMNGVIRVLLSRGNSFAPDVAWGTRSASYNGEVMGFRLGDMNGDGLPDVVYEASNAVVRVMLSTGADFGADTDWGTRAAAYHSEVKGFKLVDMNGDGLSDLVYEATNGVGRVMLSKGNTFAPDAAWGTRSGVYHSEQKGFQLLDMNGDGLSDLVYEATNGVIRVLPSSGAMPDILASIAGFQANNSVVYKPLTHAATYIKDSGPNASVYPKLDIQSPMYVVSSVSSSNGIGGSVTTNYKYGGLKAEIGTGRGLLGFRWMESTQAETGIITRTEYRQDWPYVGLPSIVKKSLPGAGNNGLLSQVSNSYSCLNPQSGSACTISTGNRYFPYLSQSVESSWDLNGTALPIVTTTHQFDAWGNATQVTVGTNDGYSKTTTNQYSNDATNWYLGRLTRSQVQSVTP